MRSGGREESQRSVRDATSRDETTEEFSESGEVRIRQSIVEARQVFEAIALLHSGRNRGLRGEYVEVIDAPVTRLNQIRMDGKRIGDRGRSLGDPHRKDEG